MDLQLALNLTSDTLGCSSLPVIPSVPRAVFCRLWASVFLALKWRRQSYTTTRSLQRCVSEALRVLRPAALFPTPPVHQRAVWDAETVDVWKPGQLSGWMRWRYFPNNLDFKASVLSALFFSKPCLSFPKWEGGFFISLDSLFLNGKGGTSYPLDSLWDEMPCCA